MKRNRKGRPRKQNVNRTPNGRIVKDEEINMQTVIEARQRVLGVPAALAKDQKAGSVLGRLRLANAITEPQYEAGERFKKEHGEMLRAIQASDGLEKHDPTGMGFEWELGAHDPEKVKQQADYTTRAIGAVARHRVAKDRLSLPEWFAVQEVVLEDREPLAVMPLEMGLTCLARGYGLLARLPA